MAHYIIVNHEIGYQKITDVPNPETALMEADTIYRDELFLHATVIYEVSSDEDGEPVEYREEDLESTETI